MATDRDFITYVIGQMQNAGDITYRKMFGEYAVYCDGKVVALVCDNRLFVKPTKNGRAFAGDIPEEPAYPGAKPSLVIEDRLDDREWLEELIRITSRELPDPTPTKKKAAKKTSAKKASGERIAKKVARKKGARK